MLSGYSEHITCIRRQLDGGSDVVTAQLTAVLASLLKRGWLESTKEDRNTFFTELESTVASSGSTAAARRAWARILLVSCWRKQCLVIFA